MLQQIADGWNPPIKNTSRILGVTFGGLPLAFREGQSWRHHHDIEDGAVFTASVVPLDVPHRHLSIQSAIRAAEAGAVVTVAEGEYSENLVLDKEIHLEAEKDGSVTLYLAPAHG